MPEAVEISTVHVHPEARGRGIGSALIQSAEQQIVARGRGVITIAVADDNPRAAALYDGLDEVLDRYDEVRRRTFLKIASPAATAYKRLVFGTDPAGLDAIFAAMAAEDEATQRANMLTVARLRTPSLSTPSPQGEAAHG